MNWTRRTALVAGAVIVAVAAGHANAQQQGKLKLGYSIAKTGLFAAGAPSQINAYNLWAEAVNAKGGLAIAGGGKRQIELVQYDDESDPSKAVRIYERLITVDKVDLLLAPWGTPHHFALAPVLERYQFPMVGNTASSVQLRELKVKNIWFPTSAIADKNAVEMAKLLKSAGVQKVALITNQLPFGMENKKFLLPELQKAGIQVVVDQDYPPDIKDMTAVLTAVKRAAPDAVLALAYPADSVLYVNKARELNLEAKYQYILVGPAIAFFRKALGKSADGIITMGHWAPDMKNAPRAKPFYDAYVKKFSEEPDYLDSALAYASCEILEQAVGKAGLDKNKLRQTISTDTFDTVFGKVKFTGVQNATTPTMFLQIQDGKLHIVWPPAEATHKLQPKGPWPK
jgi:branched-chain amino acid transport system substrate-binding protein